MKSNSKSFTTSQEEDTIYSVEGKEKTQDIVNSDDVIVIPTMKSID